jgi:hypothetical protein
MGIGESEIFEALKITDQLLSGSTNSAGNALDASNLPFLFRGRPLGA